MDTTAKPQYDDGVVKYLAVGAITFLVLGTFLGTFAAAQLAWPALNFDIAEITFARLRVMHTNTVIFAFGGMTLMATAYYTVQRTNGVRLWSNGMAWVNAILFTIGLLAVVLTISLGMTTGKEYHEQEWPLAIAIALVWTLYTLNFVMTIASRNKETHPNVYVSNWFFMGMMIAITYLYVVNGLAIPVSMFRSYSLFAGVQDAMIQWWWGHNAVGDKKGIKRYGHAYVPLDEALSRVVIDLSGRPGLVFKADFTRASIGGFDTELVAEFFQGFTNHAQTTLHIDCLRGKNAHHQAEMIFKAFGRALRMALETDERMADQLPSTKGAL